MVHQFRLSRRQMPRGRWKYESFTHERSIGAAREAFGPVCRAREDVRRRRRLDARATRGGRRKSRWEELETVVQLLEGLGQLNGELRCGLPREKSCIGTQLTRPWCPLQAQFLTGDPPGRLWPQPNIEAGSCPQITLLMVSGRASSSLKGELSSMSSQQTSYIFFVLFYF